MATSFTDIFLLMVAFGLVFGGFLGFVATVEHRNHCTVEETFEDSNGQVVLHYSDLDSEQQEVFERLVAHPETTRTAEACPDGVIRNNETYYRINHWRTIIWTNPLTLVSITVSVSGVGLLGWRVRDQLR